MKARVLTELERIERQYAIRVLLAVESGSRAWGFASPDSDYDVRFVYAHERDWYIAVSEPRDVIEEMLPDDLDVSGWDVRKTLRLFAKCNLALNEWLGSPVTYFENEHFRRELAALIPQYFNPIGAIHHYRSTATTAFDDNCVDGRIRIKKLFYVLRPLLACRWIEHTRSQPPTEFARLVASQWVSDSEKLWIGELLERKARAKEAEPYVLEAPRAEAIRAELERYKSAADFVAAPSKAALTDLDVVLRRWVAN